MSNRNSREGIHFLNYYLPQMFALQFPSQLKIRPISTLLNVWSNKKLIVKLQI
jgi:hypothetical protein